jgi:hypothetical protein
MIAPLSRWAAVAVAVAATTAAARADSFGGIAANEKRYLVGAARICEPLTVTAGRRPGAARAAPPRPPIRSRPSRRACPAPSVGRRPG